MDATIQGSYNKYHIIKVLGRGGMGEVLLARDEKDRPVAIKRPFASALADGLARFKLEAKATTLEHENIPKVYETGIQEDGLPFMAMEYVEGDTLEKLINSGKLQDLSFKLRIIEQVCAGLGYAHRNGVIHRDIKPANVIVQSSGIVKIIDFGIAKITDLEHTSELTQTSQIIGSLHYIAPERFKGEAADGRADVFSTGVMLYLLLTGKLPFVGGEATASYQIVNEAHTSLSLHIKDYPPALDAIMDQALAKDPEDRFATAEDFGDALHEVIEDLKKSRVFELFDDAERLTMESRYEPALELLDEAIKLDPANTQVRKLRRLVRENQERRRRAERAREYVVRADGFLAVENYTDALAQLKEAYRIDPTSQDLKDRIALVEDKKQRSDRSVAALAEAEAAQKRGDVTSALRIIERTLIDDSDNAKLLAARTAIANQLEREKQQAEVAEILDSARVELAARNYFGVEQLLGQAEAIDRSYPRIEELRREMVRTREQEERRQLLEEINRRVNDSLREGNYEQATDLLARAILKLPGETALHKRKIEVDTAARKFNSDQYVNHAIASAKDAFSSDPQRAFTILQDAIGQMPGDPRLIACEQALRKQEDAVREKQRLNQILRDAQGFLSAGQFDKAIDVLETYQLEHGNQAELEELLSLSKLELASQQRKILIDQTLAEARSIIEDGRLDDAVRLLEFVLKSPTIGGSGDGALSGLLENVRAQILAATRKREALLKKVVALRDRGELNEAIHLLTEYLATAKRTAETDELLSSLQAERERKQVTAKAIAAAELSTQQARFTSALESLQAVAGAYGESEELTRATQQVHKARSAHAQQVVSRAIEASRTAILARDIPGTLAALRTANEMLEFADAAKQADWKRIAQAATEAQKKGTGTIALDPLADIGEFAPSRKPLMLGLGLATCAVLGVIGYFLLRPKIDPNAGKDGSHVVEHPIQTDAHITVAVQPLGAFVSIDGGKTKQPTVNGSLTLKVAPGPVVLEVTKETYTPFSKTIQVAAGQEVPESIILTPEPKNPGFLEMKGNLPEFKVTVDGKPRGEFPNHGSFELKLEEGSHTVQYSNDDDTDTQTHQNVQIAAGKPTTDSFSLKSPLPPTGSLVVVTTRGASVMVDGAPAGTADPQTGEVRVPSLSVGEHSVAISLADHASANASVSIEKGHEKLLSKPLDKNAVTTGSLSIHTTTGAAVTLSGPGGYLSHPSLDGSGNATVQPLQPGNYKIEIAESGYQTHPEDIPITAGQPYRLSVELTHNTITERVVDKTPPPPPPPVDHTAEDKANIQAAINAFESAYQAAYKTKNLSQIPDAWLNKGRLADLFKNSADMAQIQETNCSGLKVIDSDNTATEHCTETAQLFKDIKNYPPQPVGVTLSFVKTGSTWKLISKTSP
jgi:tetratricopeptide (TPR) repeat protein/predicted Ser/Thr protein kinase